MKNPSTTGVTFHFDVQEGWICETPFVLNPVQLAAAIRYTVKVQRDRIKTWPAGDRKSQAEIALSQLTPTSVRQRMVPSQNNVETVLY